MQLINVRYNFKLKYDFSADKKIMGSNDYNAMRKAEKRAKALVNNFVNESIFTESVDSMTEITTTYSGESMDGDNISDYFSESFTESRLKYESSGYVMGFKKIKSRNAINSISGEPIHIYIGSISAKDLRDAIISKNKGQILWNKAKKIIPGGNMFRRPLYSSAIIYYRLMDYLNRL